MRIVVAKRHGRRGAGLGNELLPWAKGWIASQVLDAHLVGPSWGINQRRYWRNFGTSRLDFVLEDALQFLPHHKFTESDYRATGKVDFGSAIAEWTASRGLSMGRSFIVTVEGMWGGYPSIRNARPFLLAKLLSSRDVLRNVYQVLSTLDREKLFVAVHMRLARDGFVEANDGDAVRGKFNIFIPGEWYLWVCDAIKKEFRDRVQFWFFTDHPGPTFEAAVRLFNRNQIQQQGLTECSDLALMAQADLRVCSVSSYSLAASFLSGGPYLWYEPQLSLNRGIYSLWGHTGPLHDPESIPPNDPCDLPHLMEDCGGGASAPNTFLGTAMKIGDPLPESLIRTLEHKLRISNPRTNLLEYGCLPADLGQTMLA
jgi:hypothetical protein